MLRRRDKCEFCFAKLVNLAKPNYATLFCCLETIKRRFAAAAKKMFLSPALPLVPTFISTIYAITVNKDNLMGDKNVRKN